MGRVVLNAQKSWGKEERLTEIRQPQCQPNEKKLYFRPTTITEKLPGTIEARGFGRSGVGAGLGPISAATI